MGYCGKTNEIETSRDAVANGAVVEAAVGGRGRGAGRTGFVRNAFQFLQGSGARMVSRPQRGDHVGREFPLSRAYEMPSPTTGSTR